MIFCRHSVTPDRPWPGGYRAPFFIGGPPADGQEPRRHNFGEILRPGRPERRKTVKPFESAHRHSDRRGRQIAQRGVGHGGKYRNIRLIHGSCQAGPGRDRSLFLDSLLADQSMEQSHKPPGGTGHSCPLPHTPAISSVAYTRGAAGSWSSASRLVFAYTPRRRWGPTGSQRRRPTDVHTATTTHLNFVQV